MTTPQDAFNLLADVFLSRGNEVLEIEIIPSSLGSPFLRDGNSIGITKKTLVQAFTVARQIYNERRTLKSPQELFSELLQKKPESEILMPVVTEIILLFDCEHITACNWRKRWLAAAIIHDCESAEAPPSFSAPEMCGKELTLLQTYQCSPLHRHTKSPTLWSHRLWALHHYTAAAHGYTLGYLTQLEEKELNIVLRAAELHPKNYYAFTYMRNLHGYVADVMPDVAGHPDVILPVLLDKMLKWCLSNPRDISGWTYVIYLLDRRADQEIRANTLRRVLRFALDVGWEGESLWTFIDQAARRFELEPVINETFSLESGNIIPEPVMSHSQKWPWRNRLSRAREYWAAGAAAAAATATT